MRNLLTDTTAASTDIDATDVAFGKQLMPVHTSMGSLTVSRDLIEDAAFDLVDYLMEMFVDAAATSEAHQFAVGDGTSEAEGIITAAQHSQITAVSSGGSLATNNIMDLVFSLPAQYRTGAAFVMSSTVLKAVAELKESTTNAYIFPKLLDERILVGHPVYCNDFFPDTTSGNYPIVFGDFSGYVIADRIEASIQITRERVIKQNQVEVIFRKRMGGATVQPYKFRCLHMS
jgi:HK97 family phage major capsid protein